MDGQTHDDIHWLSITNSILVAIFLTALVALILVRTLRKDLMRYNRIPTDEEKAEELEESGWKLVHGDVFRPPSSPLLFSVVVGSGIQCFWMTFATVSFAALGFLSPANRGSFITAFLVLFVLLGAVGGFYSARMYKTLNGTGYQLTTLLTAFGFPGILFLGFFIINLFVWGYGSSAAVPFTSMLAVCALWFGISVPLTFVGAFLGYGRDPYEHPTRVNTLPRQIPDVPWYMTNIISILIGGTFSSPTGCYCALLIIVCLLF
jgi:transmembrane 9 superfamily member 2/4